MQNNHPNLDPVKPKLWAEAIRIAKHMIASGQAQKPQRFHESFSKIGRI